MHVIGIWEFSWGMVFAINVAPVSYFLLYLMARRWRSRMPQARSIPLPGDGRGCNRLRQMVNVR